MLQPRNHESVGEEGLDFSNSLTCLPTLAARKASRGFDIDFKMGCTKRQHRAILTEGVLSLTDLALKKKLGKENQT